MGSTFDLDIVASWQELVKEWERAEREFLEGFEGARSTETKPVVNVEKFQLIRSKMGSLFEKALARRLTEPVAIRADKSSDVHGNYDGGTAPIREGKARRGFARR